MCSCLYDCWSWEPIYHFSLYFPSILLFKVYQGVQQSWNSWKSWNCPGIWFLSWNSWNLSWNFDQKSSVLEFRNLSWKILKCPGIWVKFFLEFLKCPLIWVKIKNLGHSQGSLWNFVACGAFKTKKNIYFLRCPYLTLCQYLILISHIFLNFVNTWQTTAIWACFLIF